ncbi:unnamed protein product [Brassica rapa subsp. narinosa]
MVTLTANSSVADLYSCIKENSMILQSFELSYFKNTPLHDASLIGNIDLAMELLTLKPSFAKMLNNDGYSPLHLAVENNQIELALELIKFDPSLVRIHGKGGMTPLHLLVNKGYIDLLTEFLLACPESIRDVNVNGETALHITVMNDRYEELKVLRGWMQRMRKSDASSIEMQVLNKGDRGGNTALHLAASKNNHQLVSELLKCMLLNRNIRNNKGKTALDVLRDIGPLMDSNTEKLIQKSGGKNADLLSKVETTSVFLVKPVNFWEYCSIGMSRYRNHTTDGTRNALLVITALMITATYQTAVQPYDKDEQEYLTDKEYQLEMVLVWGFNTIAFCLAIALTFILLPVGRAYTWWYILISGPLVCSFGISVYLKYDIQPSFVIIYLIFIFGFLLYAFVFYMKWKRGTQKNVPAPKSEPVFRG